MGTQSFRNRSTQRHWWSGRDCPHSQLSFITGKLPRPKSSLIPEYGRDYATHERQLGYPRSQLRTPISAQLPVRGYCSARRCKIVYKSSLEKCLAKPRLLSVSAALGI